MIKIKSVVSVGYNAFCLQCNQIICKLQIKLKNTVNGAIELFYRDKKQARALLQNKGLQLPKTLSQDGFVNSIHNNRSNVKPKFRDVTESKQFNPGFKYN